ncbi:MAG: hypothetical protein LBM99_02430 [Bacillales bacterium]|jgi:hypothetical protein|nr:hypothetical protein [Bacillales bacterium]
MPTIINLIVNGLLFLVVGLGFLFGMLKGKRKAFFYLIWLVVSVLIFFLIVNPLVNLVLGMKLPFLNSTLFDFVLGFIPNQYQAMFEVNAPLHSLLVGVLAFLVKFVLFIVFFVVFLFVLAPIFRWITYKIFCLFIPALKYKKERRRVQPTITNDSLNDLDDLENTAPLPVVREKKKGALLGGLFGALYSFIILGLLIAPVNFIVHTVAPFTNLFRNEETEEYLNYFDLYEKSLLNKSFSLIKDNGIPITDTVLTDLMTISTPKGKINLAHDAALLSSIAADFFAPVKDNLDTENYIGTLANIAEPISDDATFFTNSIKKIKKIQTLPTVYAYALDYLEYEIDNGNDQFASVADVMEDKEGLLTININEDIVKLLETVIKVLPVFIEATNQQDLLTNLIDHPEYVSYLLDGILSLDTVNVGVSFLIGFLSGGDTELSSIINEGDFSAEEITEDLQTIGTMFVNTLNDVKEAEIDIQQFIEDPNNINYFELIKGISTPFLDNFIPEDVEAKTIFDLNIYQKIDYKLTKYMVNNYIAGNESLNKFIQPSDILSLYSETETHAIKKEVVAIVGTLKKLLPIFPEFKIADGAFEMDFSQINGEFIEILGNGMDESRLLQNVFSTTIGGFLPSLNMSRYEFNDIIRKLNDDNKALFSWKAELSYLAGIADEINIFSMMDGEVGFDRISENLLIAFAKQDEEDVYLIDNTILIPKILNGVLPDDDGLLTSLKGMLNRERAEDELINPKSLGHELGRLKNILLSATALFDGVEGERYILIETMTTRFQEAITCRVVDTISLNVIGSDLIPDVLNSTMGPTLQTYAETDNWLDTDWSRELGAISRVFLEGEIVADDEEPLGFDDLESQFENVKIILLEKVRDNIEDSWLLQGLLGSILKPIMAEPDTAFVLRWREDVLWEFETSSLVNLATTLDTVDGKIRINDLTNNSDFNVATIAVLGEYNNCTELIRKIILNSGGLNESELWEHLDDIDIRDISLLTTLEAYDGLMSAWVGLTRDEILKLEWVNTRWSKEMEALGVAADKLATDGKFGLNSDFSGELDVEVFKAISDVIPHSTLLQKKLSEQLFKYQESDSKNHEYLAPQIEFDIYFDSSYHGVIRNDGFTNAQQWTDEIGAIYYMIKGTDLAMNDKVNLSELTSFLSQSDTDFDLRIFRNAGLYINKSTYLQIQVSVAAFGAKNLGTPEDPIYINTDPDAVDIEYDGEVPQIGYDPVAQYLISNDLHLHFDGIVAGDYTNFNYYGKQWNDELLTLYKVLKGTKVVEPEEGFVGNEEYETHEGVVSLDRVESILNNSNSEIELSIVKHLADYIHTSTYFQYRFRHAMVDLILDGATTIIGKPNIRKEFFANPATPDVVPQKHEYLTVKYSYDFVNEETILNEWNTEIATLEKMNYELAPGASEEDRFVVLDIIKSEVTILSFDTLNALIDIFEMDFTTIPLYSDATTYFPNQNGVYLKMLLVSVLGTLSGEEEIVLNKTYFKEKGLVTGSEYDVEIANRGEFVFAGLNSDLSYLSQLMELLGVETIELLVVSLAIPNPLLLLPINNATLKAQYDNSLLLYKTFERFSLSY